MKWSFKTRFGVLTLVLVSFVLLQGNTMTWGWELLSDKEMVKAIGGWCGCYKPSGITCRNPGAAGCAGAPNGRSCHYCEKDNAETDCFFSWNPLKSCSYDPDGTDCGQKASSECQDGVCVPNEEWDGDCADWGKGTGSPC